MRPSPTIGELPNEASEYRTKNFASRMRPLLLVLKASLPLSLLFMLTSGFNLPDIEILREPLISNFSVANGKTYQWHKMALGEHIYIDRNYTFSTLPAKYMGLYYLRTANDDKDIIGIQFIKFQANQAVTIYVVYAQTETSYLPSWLQTWDDTGDRIVTTDRRFIVLAKDFPAGMVHLDGNEMAPSMYSVLVEPQSTTHRTPSGQQNGSSHIYRAPADEFGIPRLYPSKPKSGSWNALHWSNGNPRIIANDKRDPYDHTRWSMKPDVSGYAYVDGNGTLIMGGSSPRFYLQDYEGESLISAGHFWKNVEITIYYRRISDQGLPYAGLGIGARTGPHVGCDATTYYAILRNDGDLNFVKELQHPVSRGLDGQMVWDGDHMPYDQWIGMKFVIYNVNDDQHVKLEAYLDRSGGVDGGIWEKVSEYTDAGGWVVPHNCEGMTQDHIITEGGGVIFIRNSGVDAALYKWLTVREITVANGPGS